MSTRYAPISSELFSDRRKGFMQRMERNTLAIFYSNDLMTRNGDAFYPYRQDSHLFALSGLDQEGTILVLFPDSKDKGRREMLFVLPPDRKMAIWTGKRYSKKEASELSGINAVYFTKEWNKIMTPLIKSVSGLYMHTHQKEEIESGMPTQNDRMHNLLKSQYPKLEFLPASPILRSLMMIKHPVEINLMKSAIEVTGKAFERVCKMIRPGMKEYEIEAEITYVFSQHGCQHSFEPIVASGPSACTLHYTRNSRMIKKHELVLLDFGAEYAFMASDMTRTIPASGRFTKRQRDVYLSVLRILEEMTGVMQTGVTLAELNKHTGHLVERELVQLQIISPRDIRRQDSKTPIRHIYFMHGISHHLGFDVHDLHDKSVPLKAGMVLTCEPGLYIKEEKTGIRLENDILITKKNPVNLMAGIPIHPDEIEDMLQDRHP